MIYSIRRTVLHIICLGKTVFNCYNVSNQNIVAKFASTIIMVRNFLFLCENAE